MEKQNPFYVIGHRNPDADSVASAYVYAWFRNQVEPECSAQALRLGEVNAQTKWIFEYAEEPLPVFKSDCRPRVSDVMEASLEVNVDAPLSQAMALLYRSGEDVVAVKNEAGELCGLISDRLPRTTFVLQCNIEDMVGELVSFDALVRGLRLEMIREEEVRGRASRIILPVCAAQLLEAEIDQGDIVICGDNVDVARVAEERHAAAIIFADLSEEKVRSVAADVRIPAYRYDGTLLSMVTKLPGCIPCGQAMEETFLTVSEDMVLADTRKILAQAQHSVLVVGENGQLKGRLSSRSLLEVPRPRVCLVDHFETSQSIDGLEEADIVEIIDHHRIGDIETRTPLSIDCRPWGATASIVFSNIESSGVPLKSSMACLLLGALISDTLLLNSPTTTEIDRKIAGKLAKISGLELEEFGWEVLRQNDRLRDESGDVLVGIDCKRFVQGDVAFLVSQIETIDMEQLSEAKAVSVCEALNDKVKEEGCQFGVAMITDVIKQFSRNWIVSKDSSYCDLLVPAGESERGVSTSWLVEGLVSRKKQMIPYILKRLIERMEAA